MRIADDVLEQVRAEGFAVVEGFLSPEELAAARAGMSLDFPSHEDFFADPAQHERLVKHQFAGNRRGPLRSFDVNRLAFHPDLVDAAERFCGTIELQLYKIELWAKYSGGADYDQRLHRDYGNHSLVIPRQDGRWPQLTSFTLLSDVTESNGPTKVVPRSIGNELAPVSQRVVGKDDETLTEHEVAVTGPAGSLFLYTTDILHRGSSMVGHPESRFMLLADYSVRGLPWMGKMSWPDSANDPAMVELLERATVRERDLFGFPPPGHEYWDAQTLADTAIRYPNMDMTPYRTAARIEEYR